MSTSIATTFKQFCEQLGLKYYALGGDNFLTYFTGQNGKWQIFCNITGTRLHCYSVLPIIVPQEKQREVMEYLTRANYGLSIGNFEMDLRDGEIRFKSSVEMADGELTPGMIAAPLYCNLGTTDRYLKGLLYLLFADQQPATAIRAVEATEDDDEPYADGLDELLGDMNLEEWLGLDDD